MFNSGSPSLADIAAVTEGNRNNGTFDGNGAWWVLIILLALFRGGGFGDGFGANNGRGCGCNSSEPVTVINVPPTGYGYGGLGMGVGFSDAAMQRGFDNQSVINKLDSLSAAFCSLGYDQLGQNNNTNNLITQTGFNIERTAQQNAIANMQAHWDLSRQSDNCCCKIENLIQQLKFDMSSADCATRNLINENTRELMWEQQNGFRNLSDLINARFNELNNQQKDAVIADLRQRLNDCDRNNALQSLGQQIVNQISPRAMPAYPACNPNGIGNWSPNALAGGGYNNDCGRSCNSCC